MPPVLIFALALGLAACSNTVTSLHYTPPASVRTVSNPTIGTVTAIDQRKETPNRLATIMGMYGNPLKTLDTAKPVKDEVADAFTEGLRARGLLSSSVKAPYKLTLVVRKFDADMIMGRTARIDLTMMVANAAGETVFKDSATDTESGFSLVQTGIFADIGDMKALSQTVLDRTVDRMLDNPAFRAVLARLPTT